MPKAFSTGFYRAFGEGTTVIIVTTMPTLEGYCLTDYKGTVQAVTFDELLRHAEAVGANAILDTCYDDRLDTDTLYHRAAVVIERVLHVTHLQAEAIGTPDQAPESAIGNGAPN